MKYHFLLLLSLLFSISVFSEEIYSTTLIKVAKDNPTLGIVAYSGTAPALKCLRSTLQCCGWFRVLPEKDAKQAQVQLSVRFETQNGYAFQSHVRTAEGVQQIRGASDSLQKSSYVFTDNLLKELFHVPALCTKRLAYVMTGSGQMKEIFTCYLDGTDSQRLTHNNAISTEPFWGGNSKMVYTLARNNALKIILIDLVNNRQKVVSHGIGLNASASLSPSGKYMALPMSPQQRVDLYIRDLSSGKAFRLTNSRNVESSPCWSPDSREICFVSDRTGRPRLYRIGTDGKNFHRMQTGGNEAVSPDWSSVSNKLCYATRTNSGQYVIAVMDMAKANSVPEFITPDAGNWEAPSWAPDGRHIVCTRSAGGFHDLYVLDSWFKRARVLFRHVNISLPTWEK
ncbi:MAG: hypothetical protein WCS73_08770 [Lentisphaeria bacterium]